MSFGRRGASNFAGRSGALRLLVVGGSLGARILNETVPKAIALMTRSRSAVLPELATAHEQGLANFDASTWLGFFLPKGTPAPIVQKLHDATVAAMNMPAVQQRLKDTGNDVVAPERRSPAYLQKLVESEIAKWAAPIKTAGVVGE